MQHLLAPLTSAKGKRGHFHQNDFAKIRVRPRHYVDHGVTYGTDPCEFATLELPIMAYCGDRHGLNIMIAQMINRAACVATLCTG